MLTYKRKLKLTKTQQQRLLAWTGVCRLVYNMGLEIKITAWRNKQKTITAYDLINQLPSIKDTDWIADVPAQSLQNSLIDLERSFKRFFKGAGFPKFKNKKGVACVKVNNIRGTAISIIGNRVVLPKIGQLTMYKDSPIEGNIKTATIVKEPTGWFICITTDAVKNISNQDENQVIGLDMGITHFCTDSNGNHIENPRHFKKYERKLRIENRSLSRKKKGSNRWKKQAQRLAGLHHAVGNARRDFLHKQSTEIAKNYNTVYLEDLNVKGMVKNHNLSKHILDSGWGNFRLMLGYKTNVIAVDPKYTSQTCNECGCKDSKNRISQSEFACKNCGHVSNADHNAAKNILSRGTAINRKSEPVGCALVEERTNKRMSVEQEIK